MHTKIRLHSNATQLYIWSSYNYQFVNILAVYFTSFTSSVVTTWYLEVVSYLTPFTGLHPGDLDGQRALSLDRARRELQELLPRRWSSAAGDQNAGIYHPTCWLKYVEVGKYGKMRIEYWDWMMIGERGWSMVDVPSKLGISRAKWRSTGACLKMEDLIPQVWNF